MPVYITDLRHYLNERGAIAPTTGPAFKLAKFLTAVVAHASDFERDDDVPGPACFRCRKRDNVLVETAIDQDDAVVWYCAGCGSEGFISNWQESFWDLTHHFSASDPSDTAHPDKADIPGPSPEPVKSNVVSLRPVPDKPAKRAKAPAKATTSGTPAKVATRAASDKAATPVAFAKAAKPAAPARHAWEFASRFRRNAFGWRSDAPIQRLKEAVSEIRKVSRSNQCLAAEGAILLFEKLVPAIEHVDSSSGSMGSAVHRAIDLLVPVIAQAPWSPTERQRWLERLWQAVEDDGISYIESLADRWGTLCAGKELAEKWVASFRPVVERIWSVDREKGGFAYFKGTPACLSCMLAANQYDALLALLETAPIKWWHDRRWGFEALAALGRTDEALRYAEDSLGRNEPSSLIAVACERILLASGRTDEAYQRYAIEANRAGTNLATFRAIVAKYPGVEPGRILRDLVDSAPGEEGKWFAAAKDAGLYDIAIELATTSPTEPKTLNRAARDFAATRPEFALAAALASLRWIALGYGYEITGLDVSNACLAALEAAAAAGLDETTARERIRSALPASGPSLDWVRSILRTWIPQGR